MRKRTIPIEEVFLIILACFGEFLRFGISALPINLDGKIKISLIYVACAYILMISLCIKRRGVSNPLFILLVLSTAFYYGQHLVVAFDSKYLLSLDAQGILSGKISDGNIIRATFLIVDCLLLVTAGYLFVKQDEISLPQEVDVDDSQMHALRIAGWIFLAISILPTIKLLLSQYELSNMHGYLGRRGLESSVNYNELLGMGTIEIYIAGLFLPSLYSLLIAYRGHRHNTVIYGLLLGYCVLYYLTGSRFMILKLLVAIYIIQFNWISQIRKKDILRIVGIGVIFIAAMSIGTIIRNMNSNYVDFSEVANELKLSGILWESGITFTTVSNILEYCPQTVDFFYGKSIVGAVLQCLPEFLRFGFFDKYTLVIERVFSPLYYNHSYIGYGSSFIAEAYYNFGLLIYPCMIVYGILLGKISKAIAYSYRKKLPYKVLLLGAVCGELAYGVRNDLSSIPRLMLTTVIIIIIFSKYFELLAGGGIKLRRGKRQSYCRKV